MVTKKDNLITIELPQNDYLLMSQDLFVTQWNTGQKLAILGLENGTEVQFGNEVIETTLNRQIIDGIVEIPDIMLTYTNTIFAYVDVVTADSQTTRYKIVILVEEKTKPSDYIYPEDEPTFREEMQALLDKKQDKLTAGNNITIDENNVISATGGGSGGETMVDASINGVKLEGNKTSEELGLQPKGDYALKTDIPTDYVPNTRKVAGKELNEDITIYDILNALKNNVGQPISDFEILLENSTIIDNKANKTEALKLVQISLKDNSVKLEYVNGDTTYSEVFGLADLLQDIETKADKTYVDSAIESAIGLAIGGAY